jgi:hypothetical protein
VSGLGHIVDIFLIPLKSKNIISNDQISTIFSEVEVIKGVHKIFQSDLEKRVNEWESSLKRDSQSKPYLLIIGDVFLRVVSLFLSFICFCVCYNVFY